MNYPARKSWLEVLFTPWSLKPKVRADEQGLMASSSFLQQVLGGFSYRKELRVDSDAQTIQIQRRMLWFWRKHWEIPFERIKRIDYSFSDTGGDFFRAVLEFYTVSLVLMVPEERIPLFTFVGEYSEPATEFDLLTRGSDARYWGSQGGQAVSSGEFAKLLQHFTGAPTV